MEKALLFVSLIVSSLSLVCSLVLVVILLKKGKSPSFDAEKEKEAIEAQVRLNASIEALQKNVQTSLEVKMAEFSANVAKALKEEGQDGNQRFLSLQRSLSDSVTSQINELKESFSQRFAEIVKQEAAQMETIHKTLADMTQKDQERINGFQTTLNSTVTQQIAAINAKLDESLKNINDRVDVSLSKGFENTSQSMLALQKQLGAVEEAQKNLSSIQSEISSLNGILTSNQQRGKYGEWQLELLLENLFQDGKGLLYDLQYNLGDGLKPDAVIFLDGKAHHQIACIDSKFSLVGYESLFSPGSCLGEREEKEAKAAFKAALKQRIEETSKYVVPGKTIGNALMFIPSDGVFAFVETEYPDLVELAKKKHVVMTCPCILTPLLGAFRVVQLDAARSRSLEQINAALNGLAKEFKAFAPRWDTLNKSIQGLTTKSNEFSITVKKLDNKFAQVQQIDVSHGALDAEKKDKPEDDLIDTAEE